MITYARAHAQIEAFVQSLAIRIPEFWDTRLNVFNYSILLYNIIYYSDISQQILALGLRHVRQDVWRLVFVQNHLDQSNFIAVCRHSLIQGPSQ